MYKLAKPKTPTEAQIEAIKRRYRTEDGKLIVKSRDKTRMSKIGSSVGTINQQGHLSVHVLKSKFRVAHIIWYLHHDIWPSDAISHRDGNRTNNKIENLVMLDGKAVQS